MNFSYNYSDLIEQIKEITNKKYHEQIENEKLDIDIIYY